MSHPYGTGYGQQYGQQYGTGYSQNPQTGGTPAYGGFPSPTAASMAGATAPYGTTFTTPQVQATGQWQGTTAATVAGGEFVRPRTSSTSNYVSSGTYGTISHGSSTPAYSSVAGRGAGAYGAGRPTSMTFSSTPNLAALSSGANTNPLRPTSVNYGQKGAQAPPSYSSVSPLAPGAGQVAGVASSAGRGFTASNFATSGQYGSSQYGGGQYSGSKYGSGQYGGGQSSYSSPPGSTTGGPSGAPGSFSAPSVVAGTATYNSAGRGAGTAGGGTFSYQQFQMQQKQKEEAQRQEELRKAQQDELAKRQAEARRKVQQEEQAKQEALRQQEQEQRRRQEEQRLQQENSVKAQVQEQLNAIKARILAEEEQKRQALRKAQEEEAKRQEAARIEQQIEERVRREEERLRQEYEQRLKNESEQRMREFQQQMMRKEEEERMKREQEQRSQMAEFEQRWRERESQWQQQEQERAAQEEKERLAREEKERVVHEMRLQEEQRLIREARAQAKLNATKEMQVELEKRRKIEMRERQEREKALVSLLEQERSERAAREQELLRAQREREEHIKMQEEARMREAIGRFRAEESQRIKEEATAQFRQEEENRIRQQLERDFQQQAEARQKVYANERKHIEQAAALDRQATWIVDPSTVEVGPLIGQGAFGTVYRAKMSGKEVAVKRLNVQSVDADTMEEFEQEISIMSNLRHPNVLLFIGACTQPGNLFIVSELMAMGSLQDLLFKKQISITFKQRLQILKEVALGMHWLHSLKPPFLHRDLKSGNILLDENFNVRISDFGFVSVKCLDEAGDMIQGPIGSPFYMAPEVLLDKPGGPKSDVYSFSIVMWETLTNEDPYKDEFESYEEMVEAITLDEVRPPIPSWLSPPIAQLVQDCWSSDIGARPTFGDMLNSCCFDHFIVDSLITDPVGSAFWKAAFLEKDVVQWEEFLSAVNQFCGLTLTQADPLANLLKWLVASKASTGIEQVSIEAFASNLLDWFGPFPQARSLVDNVVGLASSGWYHGSVTAAQAEPFLRTLAPGGWLVRQGEIQGEDRTRHFFVSVNTSPQPTHVPIYQKQGAGAVSPLLFHADANQPPQEFAGWEQLITSPVMAKMGVVPANCARVSPLSAILRPPSATLQPPM